MPVSRNRTAAASITRLVSGLVDSAAATGTSRAPAAATSSRPRPPLRRDRGEHADSGGEPGGEQQSHSAGCALVARKQPEDEADELQRHDEAEQTESDCL